MTACPKPKACRRVMRCIAMILVIAGTLYACGEEERFGEAPEHEVDRAANWPSFAMVYEVRSGPHLDAVAVWHLDFNADGSWIKTLVEESTESPLAGMSEEFREGKLTIRHPSTIDPTTGKEWTLIEDLGDTPAAPDFWLIPDRDLALQERGYLDSEASDEQQLVFVMSGEFPCREMETDVSEIQAACEDSDTVSVIEETVFTQLMNPPVAVLFVETTAGVVTTVIEVTSLDVEGDHIDLPAR